MAIRLLPEDSMLGHPTTIRSCVIISLDALVLSGASGES